MTESEAIKNINALNAVCMNKEFYDVDFYLALKLAVGAIEKVQIIEAIGTVEEFKALKEKQIAKKPNKAIDTSWGVHKEVNVCPVCDCFLTEVHFIDCDEANEGKRISYCGTCGQAIDWE